jgi:predicted DsbA family dithiol-disulfide isomerase
MIPLDIISDPICPWCYIGWTNLARAMEARPDHPFAVEWHPFQLNPEMPPEGMDRREYLEHKFGGREGALTAYAPVVEHAERAGLTLNLDRIERTPNTIDAHRLIHWAGVEGRQTPVALALFRAYFVDGRDIGDPATLREIAEGAGLDGAMIATLLEGDADRRPARARRLRPGARGHGRALFRRRAPARGQWRAAARTLDAGDRRRQRAARRRGRGPMSVAGEARVTPQPKRLSRGEFIALMGTIFATVAFSIDAMLPALPEIAAELTPEDANRAQLILTSFVLGMGIGTLVVGPISDALGRKRVILMGAALYLLGASLALIAPSLEMILLARVIQGLGAAGPRVVSLAMIRDLYAGRAMAQIVSYAMLIFTLFPAVAPLIGAAIIAGFGWRAIFVAFLIFSVVSVGWLTLRQPETLPPRRAVRCASPASCRYRRGAVPSPDAAVDPDPDADLHGAFRGAQFDPAGLRHDLWTGRELPAVVRAHRAHRRALGARQRSAGHAAGHAPDDPPRALALDRCGPRHGGDPLPSSAPARASRSISPGPSRSSRPPPSPSAT